MCRINKRKWTLRNVSWIVVQLLNSDFQETSTQGLQDTEKIMTWTLSLSCTKADQSKNSKCHQSQTSVWRIQVKQFYYVKFDFKRL